MMGSIPPKPPVAPKPPKEVVAPKAPVMSVPPPPPPPPVSFEDVFDEVSTFYINGKEVSKKEARKVWDDDENSIEEINIMKENDGKKVVYIKMK